MNTVTVVLLTIGGLLVGAVLAWLAARGASSAVAQRKGELEQEVAALRGQVAQVQQDNADLKSVKAAVEATLESERSSTKEKIELLTAAGEAVNTKFEAMAASALQNNNTTFLQLAKSELEKHQTEAKAELEKREKAVENLVQPIADSLKSVDDNLRALETKRAEDYGSLATLVESLYESQNLLKAETGNLVKALREPQARGRWGELQLRRCLELAGMLDYCDFQEQVSVSTDERMLRPDVLVRLPGEKNLVVDSKVPLAAYLAALEATDEATHNARLLDHARQVRQHIDLLSAKSYWSQFEPTPNFVVLFLPGEVFFRAAMDADPELMEYGVARKVMITSPITLISLLRAVAYGWNQKNLADNARKISEAGRELYERLCKMTEHLEALGSRLDGAVKSYNDTLSSMEKRVFPAGRRMAELDHSLDADKLKELERIERVPKQLDAADWQPGDEQPMSLIGDDADRAKSRQ